MSFLRTGRQRSQRYAVFAAMMAVTALTAACSDMPATATLPVAEGPIPLAPGDQIRVTVYGQGDLTSEVWVERDGVVSLPLGGRVPVADMTPATAETAIRDRLAAAGLVVNPTVSIAVLHYRPVYVLGEVTKPGAYDLQGQTTVLNAVALAGGYTYRARPERIQVTRPEKGEPTTHSALETTTVRPGDIVMIPERWF